MIALLLIVSFLDREVSTDVDHDRDDRDSHDSDDTLSDWLTDWPINRLIDWLTDLTDWFLQEKEHHRSVKEKRFRYVEQKGFQSFFETWTDKTFKKETASEDKEDDEDPEFNHLWIRSFSIYSKVAHLIKSRLLNVNFAWHNFPAWTFVCSFELRNTPKGNVCSPLTLTIVCVSLKYYMYQSLSLKTIN